MAKQKTAFVCGDCGSEYSKWQGQCGDCGGWNTVVEFKLGPSRSGASKSTRKGFSGELTEAKVLSEVSIEDLPRFTTGVGEFDRVLGGGLVPGSAILIGGNPGAGKSTLLLQTMCHLAECMEALYITGEESLQQVAEELTSAPGSVSQVRECAAVLTRLAKQTGMVLFLVGHVTKDGSLAGPKVLEHMIDCSIMLEDTDDSRFRTLRGQKNRFGAVNELGVFAMTGEGLKEVKNPSAIFLNRSAETSSGSAVMAVWEGTRPLLVEIQALVDDSQLGNPRRVAVGLEQNRLAMLLAVLHRHGGLHVGDQDVFANVVGGVKVLETSADLALLLAIVSSFKNRPLPKDMVIFGEVGLSGEIRPVPSGQERLLEAVKHGFKRAVVPFANVPKGGVNNMEVIGVKRLSDALSALE